jgi:hypothetical protein
MMAPPLNVTFDTNALEGVVAPDSKRAQPEHGTCVEVHEALRTGRIKGYFSEAVLALDAVGRDDKVDLVGSATITSKAHATGPSTITIAIGLQWTRPLINQLFLDRIRGALALGMRALVGPRRLGDSLAVNGFGDDFYAALSSPEELVASGERANEVDGALARRCLGRARAVKLGLEYSRREAAEGELWMQGLGRARTKGERKKVRKVINEWADGDAIAAHIGTGNDLFCTYDLGRGSGPCSALRPDNRAWLGHEYGVEFVTISDLADRLRES